MSDWIQRALEPNQAHPCVVSGCETIVAFDDEPWYFNHSPDSGSSVQGYSYKATHNHKGTNQ
jgi:hypothetical protein